MSPGAERDADMADMSVTAVMEAEFNPFLPVVRSRLSVAENSLISPPAPRVGDTSGSGKRGSSTASSNISSDTRQISVSVPGGNWVESAIQRTALPDANWEPLRVRIEDQLGVFICQRITTKEEAAMMAEVVGPATVGKYTNVPIEPMVLEPCFMLPQIRKALRTSVQADLNDFIRCFGAREF